MSISANLFHANLRRLEKEKGITRSRLEADINFTTGRLRLYEKRSTLPTGKVIDKIVDYLEIETIEMFEDWGEVE